MRTRAASLSPPSPNRTKPYPRERAVAGSAITLALRTEGKNWRNVSCRTRSVTSGARSPTKMEWSAVWSGLGGGGGRRAGKGKTRRTPRARSEVLSGCRQPPLSGPPPPIARLPRGRWQPDPRSGSWSGWGGRHAADPGAQKAGADARPTGRASENAKKKQHDAALFLRLCQRRAPALEVHPGATSLRVLVATPRGATIGGKAERCARGKAARPSAKKNKTNKKKRRCLRGRGARLASQIPLPAHASGGHVRQLEPAGERGGGRPSPRAKTAPNSSAREARGFREQRRPRKKKRGGHAFAPAPRPAPRSRMQQHGFFSPVGGERGVGGRAGGQGATPNTHPRLPPNHAARCVRGALPALSSSSFPPLSPSGVVRPTPCAAQLRRNRHSVKGIGCPL